MSKFRLIEEIEAMGIASDVAECFGKGLLYMKEYELEQAKGGLYSVRKRVETGKMGQVESHS